MRHNRKGRRQGTCPRAGFVELWKYGRCYVLPTICKTWGCIACQSKVKYRVVQKMIYGCSEVGPSWFITVTFRAGSHTRVDAQYVRRIWNKFSRILKSSHPTNQWFKIVELTKKKTPHLHTLMNNIGDRTCEGGIYHRAYLLKSCTCVLHTIARAWNEATEGESYIVDVRPIVTAKGTAVYLSKYLVKSMDDIKALKALGFTRRWSSSRNWPRQAEEGLKFRDWDEVIIRLPDGEAKEDLNALIKESEGAYLMERIDQERYEEMVKQAKNSYIKKVGEQFEAIRRTGLAGSSGAGRRQGGGRLPTPGR